MKSSNLAKNTIMLGIGTLITNVLQFIMVPLFSSWLTTEDYGAFDLYITYVSLLLPLINLASGEAVFRFSIDYDDIETQRKYISNGLAIVVVNSIVFSVMLLVIYVYTQKIILIPFFVLLIGQLVNSYFQSFLRGIKRLNIYSFSTALSVVFISAFVTFFVKICNLELYGILLGYAVGYLLGNLIILFLSKYWSYFSIKSISLIGMKELISYSYPLIPNNISWWIMNASDRFIINVFLGANANGIFAIAHKVPSVCASVFGMFNISWQEAASEMADSQERNEYFNLIYNKTLAVIISLCVGILSINFILFDYIFDSKYYEASQYTSILITAIVFSSMAQYFGGIMISLKQPKENGLTTMVGAIGNLVIHFLLIKFIGLYAAAISTLVSNLLVCFVRKRRLKKNIAFSLEKYNVAYIVIYLYYFTTSFLEFEVIMRVINLAGAAFLFFYINRQMIVKLLKKL